MSSCGFYRRDREKREKGRERGEQVECRVVGGRSCVEAIVGFEFYYMERVCAISSMASVAPGSGAIAGLEDAGSAEVCLKRYRKRLPRVLPSQEWPEFSAKIRREIQNFCGRSWPQAWRHQSRNRSTFSTFYHAKCTRVTAMAHLSRPGCPVV